MSSVVENMVHKNSLHSSSERNPIHDFTNKILNCWLTVYTINKMTRNLRVKLGCLSCSQLRFYWIPGTTEPRAPLGMTTEAPKHNWDAQEILCVSEYQATSWSHPSPPSPASLHLLGPPPPLGWESPGVVSRLPEHLLGAHTLPPAPPPSPASEKTRILGGKNQ